MSFAGAGRRALFESFGFSGDCGQPRSLQDSSCNAGQRTPSSPPVWLLSLLIVFCSVAVLHFEVDRDSNIKTAEDAIWWAFATITTVGYGDRYPVTSEGRFAAAILMTAGVGLFGTFSGFLAAWFIGSEAAEESNVSSEIRALRTEIADLRKRLEDVGDEAV